MRWMCHFENDDLVFPEATGEPIQSAYKFARPIGDKIRNLGAGPAHSFAAKRTIFG